MATGERLVSDVLSLMRVILGRRNENDPDASDDIMFRYLNDFVSLSMPNDTKLFESFGTLSFSIDETNPTGVYTFNDVGADHDFINTSLECFISLRDPVGSSVSWNWLPVYQDPGEFYAIWGINNEDILIRGYPTGMLYYGTEFVFRTLPNTAYLIKMYGYKKNGDYGDKDEPLQFDYWLRYLAYGASMNYARDYRYAPDARSLIESSFKSERKLQLTHAHNQVKNSRAAPRF
jgi:hypothetical protein